MLKRKDYEVKLFFLKNCINIIETGMELELNNKNEILSFIYDNEDTKGVIYINENNKFELKENYFDKFELNIISLFFRKEINKSILNDIVKYNLYQFEVYKGFNFFTKKKLKEKEFFLFLFQLYIVLGVEKKIELKEEDIIYILDKMKNITELVYYVELFQSNIKYNLKELDIQESIKINLLSEKTIKLINEFLIIENRNKLLKFLQFIIKKI